MTTGETIKRRSSTRPTFDIRLTATDRARALRRDVLVGLTSRRKWLPPRWFYDARGSELFERITRLPEYYPTRAERSILTRHAPDIAAVTRSATLIELGSGSPDKARLLLDALTAVGTVRTYVPLDVSASALEAAAHEIARGYPDVTVRAVVADFSASLALPAAAGPNVVAFLGSTIGNLMPTERATFLASARQVLEPGDWLLLGTDLVKDTATLLRAYDDAAGVTAEFNRNVLRVLNRELGGTIPLDAFRHRTVWDEHNEWVEMRLRAERDLVVTFDALDLEVGFRAGEEVRTEVSAKFRRRGVQSELHAAGFGLEQWWTDDAGYFAVSLARAE